MVMQHKNIACVSIRYPCKWLTIVCNLLSTKIVFGVIAIVILIAPAANVLASEPIDPKDVTSALPSIVFLALSATIFLVTLVIGFFTVQHENRRNELFQTTQQVLMDVVNLDEKARNIVKDEANNIKETLNIELERMKSKMEKDAQNLVETEFSRFLEERYLALENVKTEMWMLLVPKLKFAQEQNNHTEVADLWKQYIQLQQALHQVLSKKSGDIGKGLSILRTLAGDDREILPKDATWKYICLLKQQGNIKEKHLDIAEELAKCLGKTF
jgi:hypothetical protein